MMRKKRIRSMRVARELMARGYPAIDTCEDNGYIVWDFVASPELERLASTLMRGGV